MSAESRAIIERLHAAYCRFAGVTVRLRDDTLRLWWGLLKDYNQDETLLSADLKIVLIHLRAQVQKEKRNPGAIKLANLLQPEQFESDVAEAKFLRGKKASPQPSTLNSQPVPTGWAAWVAETYPKADIPNDFKLLPDYVQEKCREALS